MKNDNLNQQLVGVCLMNAFAIKLDTRSVAKAKEVKHDQTA